MTWQDVTTLYQLATVAMVVVCILAYVVNRAALDLFAAAVVVFAFTVVSALIVEANEPPWSSAHMPPQDLICATVAWWSSRRASSGWWPRWLAIAFTAQCGIHVLYWGLLAASHLFANGAGVDVLVRVYPWPINTLFLIELAILGVAGGFYVGRYVRARFALLHRGVAATVPHGERPRR